MMKRALATIVLLGIACLAAAAEGPWYIGGSMGQAEFADCPAAASCDARDSAYKVYAGYRFNRHLALEAGYTDLGKSSVLVAGAIVDQKPRGGAAHLVAAYPIGDLSITGRVGLIYGDTKVSAGDNNRNDKGTRLAWGVGAHYDSSRHFAVRLEWERFRFERLDVAAITAGVVASF
jgi:OOP family OmpA-OmpF porin